MSKFLSNMSRIVIITGLGIASTNVSSSHAGDPPTQVSPSTNQLTHANRNNAVCAQQLNSAIIERARTAHRGDELSAALDAAGLVAEAAGALVPLTPGDILEAAAIGIQGLALVGTPAFTFLGTNFPDSPGTIPSLFVNAQAIDLDERAQGVPYCEQDFVGTVRILNADGTQAATGPGLDVSGNTLLRGNAAIDGTLEFENGIQVTGGPLGQTATAGTPSSIAIGSGANATMTGAIAIGRGAQATNVMAVAIGQGAIASGANSAAFGMFAMATGDNSTALGGNSSAAQTNTIAIGQGATTTRVNQVVIGNAQNTYTTPGIASATSLASQGDVAGVVTSDEAGNLAINRQLIPTVAQNVADIDTNRSGIAMAMALQTPYVPEDKQAALNFSLGMFENKQAAAMSGAVRLNDNWQLDGGITVGLNNGNVGGRVGATLTW